LFGFEAIIAHDGLGISVIGITIVFVSLILLSFAVSQIHKLIELWDKKNTSYQRVKKNTTKRSKDTVSLRSGHTPRRSKGFTSVQAFN